ncbi:MAG: aldehyde ferredoxin oxidoreductase family protein [Halobacteriota archaeon]|nr:aldehyde ferredoxin oxidoreductase family protein [Halobacteriota archaeon]
MFGYCGKILRINLTDGKVRFEDTPKDTVLEFIGGSGLASKILFDELKEGADPLSPDNILIFATGPVTGSKAFFSGRHLVAAKSPLTGIYGQATSGGYFGAELKYAGIDALIVAGKAEQPVYISIRDNDIEVEDAEALWGLDSVETEEEILKDSEVKTRVSCIGPAGENLVKFAAIMNDGGAAGRTGMGCVMGSKNLKAVAVKGTGEVEVAKEEELKELNSEIRKLLKRNALMKDLSEHGTSGGATALNMFGSLPTKYFTEGSFAGGNKIDGHTMSKTILKKRETCYNCPVACKRVVEIKEGPYSGLVGRGLEYETCAAFGSLCMNDSLELISKMNDLCNRLGLDTISTGNVIAFSMECYEKGLLDMERFDGIELDWGSHDMVKLVEMIAIRDGFGDLLAEGVRIAAKRIGAEDLAMHCKGLEIPMYDPRALRGMGLIYPTSIRGACHMMGMSTYSEMNVLSYPSLDIPKRIDPRSADGKAQLVKTLQDWITFINSAVFCELPLTRISKGPEFTAKLFSLVTGVDIDVESMIRIGDRIYNLQRIFNLREGISQIDDVLPKRFTDESHTKGPCKGLTAELGPMLSEYYKLRGWRDGIPSK